MTVSRVINESERVRPDTRRRVEEAIAELGYVPSRLARGLIRQRTGTLALIVPDVANPFFTLIVRGAEDVARRAGYRCILCDTGRPRGRARGDRGDDRPPRRGDRDRPGQRPVAGAPAAAGELRRAVRPHRPLRCRVDSDVVLGDSAGGARRSSST
jgi:LacI family transcriptional regulator